MISNPVKFLRTILVVISVFLSSTAFGFPIQLTDDQGRQISLNAPPKRVVSLVPSISEILFALDLEDSVQAVTYHDTLMRQAIDKQIVGGFFSPSLERILAVTPDLVFISSLHEQLGLSLKKENINIKIINLQIHTVEDSFETIRTIGKIFNKNQQAETLIESIRAELNNIRVKTAKIPESDRLRVIRLMGSKEIRAPGDDSFQNEMIIAAGGIAPIFGKTGDVINVSLEEWKRFNPQVIVGCGDDRRSLKTLLDMPGWRDVDAIRNGRFMYFPCELTCRAATHTGYFSAWLAGRLYPDLFASRANQIQNDAKLSNHNIPIELDYVKNARIEHNRIHDFVHKTLIIDFKAPMKVVSTLEGTRDNIMTVGNHYSPPSCWDLGHNIGLDGIRERVYGVTGNSSESASFLFTGADMDNLAIGREQFKEMVVFAFVTAGVKSNALRMSRDTGDYYEPGTINMILITNTKLSPRAMTRAIIAATEAKTAALSDLDIRSSYHPLDSAATGTGTDNMIVVQGTGANIDNAGGHSKMGELMAKAVYEAVREAVFKQNGLTARRNIFHRLGDRQISMLALFGDPPCECGMDAGKLGVEVEQLLLEPRYSGFVAAAMDISDATEAGLVQNRDEFEKWAVAVAGEISGVQVESLTDLVNRDDIPVVLKTALNAVATGIYHRQMQQGQLPTDTGKTVNP
jgi:ABC-type Fe3+-hydroxamate transport system substrate-binding protein/adenosylcobinamide amidohydrolase